MNSNAFSALAVVLVFGFVDLSKAQFQCWSCVSDQHGSCADFFNTTALQSSRFYSAYNLAPNSGVVPGARLVTCDLNNNPYGSGYQKPACLKKKLVNTRYSTTTYVRQCQYVHANEQMGKCPSEQTSSDTQVEFCEYCDPAIQPGCNSAEGISGKFYAGIVSLIVVYALLQ